MAAGSTTGGNRVDRECGWVALTQREGPSSRLRR